MKRAVLAAVRLKGDRHFENRMNECRRLCEAAGYEIAAEAVQTSRHPDPDTMMRSGRIMELKECLSAVDADTVIFYNGLRPSEAGRIAEITGARVLDRTTLILDLFAARARSASALMQVELARLEYELPGVIRSQDEQQSHERGGGVTNRGGGEMRASGIRRKYRRRISDLKKKLKNLEMRNREAGQRRRKSGLKQVALVGYTNAGKSSLLNALMKKCGSTGSFAEEKDMLFATLDTSIRRIEWKDHAFLLYDTVGFVSDLPHTLVEAFRSTLSAVCDADLLIEVVDASDPEWEVHMDVTAATLKQINAGEIEVLHVFNKIDLADENRFRDYLCVSCKEQEGLEDLLDEVIRRLFPEETVMHCVLPYEKLGMLDDSHSLQISVLKPLEDGMMIEIRGEKVRTLPFADYQVREDEYEDRMGQA